MKQINTNLLYFFLFIQQTIYDLHILFMLHQYNLQINRNLTAIIFIFNKRKRKEIISYNPLL